MWRDLLEEPNILQNERSTKFGFIDHLRPQIYNLLVNTTQQNSAFRAQWLASSEVISQVLLTSKQPKKNKMAFYW